MGKMTQNHFCLLTEENCDFFFYFIKCFSKKYSSIYENIMIIDKEHGKKLHKIIHFIVCTKSSLQKLILQINRKNSDYLVSM